MTAILPKKKKEPFKEKIDETSRQLRLLKQKDWSRIRKKVWNFFNWARLKYIELN
jgi:hypothetical protein